MARGNRNFHLCIFVKGGALHNMSPWTDNQDEGKIGRKTYKTTCEGHMRHWPSDLTHLTDGRGKNL
jgi:hypothetical protein